MPRNLNDIPFAPRRFPVFYGWAILAVGAVGVLMSAPGQTIGFSAFTDSLIGALGLSRLKLSIAYMIGTAMGSLLLTRAGRLYDRFGARVVGPGACLVLAGVLLALSFVDRAADRLVAVTGISGWAVPFVVISLGFFALRFSGQGVLTLVSRNMIMKWFDRRRGLANGVCGVGIALGFSSAPWLLNELIDGIGWQWTWRWTAGVIGLGFAGVALLLYRDNPEDCGLLPDGTPAKRHVGEGQDVPPPAAHRQFTLAEAQRCYSFWVFTSALAMFGLYMTGLTFHIESIFRSRGFAGEEGFEIFMPAALIAVTTHLFGGWLSDFVKLKWLLMAELAGLGLSMLALTVLARGLPVWMMVLGNGLCSGMFGVLSAVTWPDFFGRKHLGAVSGRAMAAIVFASAVGPMIFGLSKKFTGLYTAAALLCLAVIVALLAAAKWADNPQVGRTDAGVSGSEEGVASEGE